MKKVKFLGAIVIGLFFICSGCPDNVIAKLNNCNLEKVVKSVAD